MPSPARQRCLQFYKEAAVRTRILIVDDQPMIRSALAFVLRDEPDFYVVGEAQSAREAVDLAKRFRPSVVLMDVSMPGIDGGTATRLLRQHCPDVRIVGLSLHDTDYMANLMREAGAVGYVAKREGPDRVVEAVRAAAHEDVHATKA